MFTVTLKPEETLQVNSRVNVQRAFMRGEKFLAVRVSGPRGSDVAAVSKKVVGRRYTLRSITALAKLGVTMIELEYMSFSKVLP